MTHIGRILMMNGVLAVLLLQACSISTENAAVQQEPSAIGFRAYVGMTRSAQAPQKDVTNSTLADIQVYAGRSDKGGGSWYIQNETFSRNSDGNWASVVPYYWPSHPLDFYAFNLPSAAPEAVVQSFDYGSSSMTLTATPPSEISSQTDLVAAYLLNQTDPWIADVTSAPKPVTLTFNHYLTKIQVRVSNACPDSYSVRVDGVKIANMAPSGTYHFYDSQAQNTMTATIGSDKSSQFVDYRSVYASSKMMTVEPQNVMNVSGDAAWYLIPQSVYSWNREDATDGLGNSENGTFIGLKVLIVSQGGANLFPKTGSETAWMAVPLTEDGALFNFLQGHQYIFNINFFSKENGGAGFVDPEEPGDSKGQPIVRGKIKFNALMNAWDDISEITINL